MSYLQKNSIFIFVILLILLTVPSIFGVIHPGFFLSDDGNWMIIRFSAFYDALRNGQIPPRFLLQLNHGYGYPVADFLYPLFMYIGMPIHVLGINFTNTIKVILVGSMMLSGILTFLWLKKIVKVPSALVGGVIYVIAPYHLWDLYHRGSVGEILALCVVPFVLWQMERKNSLWIAIGIAFLITAHNSLALLYLPFLLGYAHIRKLFSWKYLLGIVGYSLALCAFFWIPALYDKQFTIFDKTPVSNISDYFISTNTTILIGWIGILIILLSFPLLLRKLSVPLRYFWIIGMGTLVLTLPFSSWIWKISHLAPYIQFPYRFLSVTILSFAAISSFIVDSLSKRTYIFGLILLFVVGYFSSWNLFFPTTYQYYPDTFFSTNQDSTTVHNEYTPIWVKTQPTVLPQSTIEITKGNGVVTDVLEKGGKVIGNAIINSSSMMQINVAYFPGWKVYIDGKDTPFSYNNEFGVIQFPISSGVHAVSAVFGETPIRVFSDIVTILSIFLLPLAYKKAKKYEKT